ncbi:hypothetical protein D3C81_2020940 [compost metagenome]
MMGTATKVRILSEISTSSTRGKWRGQNRRIKTLLTNATAISMAGNKPARINTASNAGDNPCSYVVHRGNARISTAIDKMVSG